MPRLARRIPAPDHPMPNLPALASSTAEDPMKTSPPCLSLLGVLMLLCGNLYSQAESITVQVRDPSGLPVSGAAVSLALPSGRQIATGHTQAGGSTTFSVSRGFYLLSVTASGFAPYRRELTLHASETAELAVELQLVSLATEIEVTASPPAQIAIEDVPAARLQSGPPRDLAERLKEVPGVLAVRRGGTNLEPVVQGLREHQVAMVVDGSRAFAAGPARMDSEISHVDPARVSNLEVIKGPYALSECAGGLAAVLVKTDPLPVHDKMTFGGSVSTGYAFNSANRWGNTRYFASGRRAGISVRASGGKGDDYRAGTGSAPGPTVPGRFGEYQVGGKLRLNLTSNQELSFDSGLDTQQNLDYPGRLLDANHFITRSWNGAYYLKEPAPAVQSVTFRLYLSKKSHRMNNDGKPTAMDMPGRVPPFGLAVSLPTESDTLGGAGRISFQPRSGWAVQTGFDFYDLSQQATRFISRRSNNRLLFRDNVWPDARIRDQGLYLNAAKAGENWGMAAAVRFDTVQAEAGRPSDFFRANTSEPMNRKEFNTSWSLTARRNLTEAVTVSGGLGRAVRTANVLERYSDRFPGTKFQVAAEFMGTPGIEPETSHQADLGLEFRWAGMRLRAGGYYRRIQDFITVAPAPGIRKRLPLSPPQVFRYLSGDHANFRGLDFSVRAPITEGLELGIQGAYTLADDIEQALAAIGVNEPVLGIPPLEVRSRLRYTGDSVPFYGEFEMRNVGPQDRVAASRLEAPSPGFTTLSLRGGLQLPKRLSLEAGVENLGDKFYFEHLNSLNPFTRERIPEMGRFVFVGVTKKW